jgi:hypothetical protein
MVIKNYTDFYELYRMVSLDIIDEIDRLWVKHSEGKFSIKGQAKIYRDLGGTTEYYGKVWFSFGDRIAWRKRGIDWLEIEEVAYHATTQPENHFPILMYLIQGQLYHFFGWSEGGRAFSSLASRLKRV